MKQLILIFLLRPLLFSCIQDNLFVQQVLQSDDFSPIAAGQNEVFYSKGSIFKEIRLPKDIQEQQKKEKELMQEYEALKQFSQEYYVSGLSRQRNSCTYSYIETDVIKLENEQENFQPYQRQKIDGYYCYQDRLIKHNFLTLDHNSQFNQNFLADQKINNKNLFKTYLLRMKKANGDLLDMLQDEKSQNWSWRLDICYQLINIFKLFKQPIYNYKKKGNDYWHHLDIKPENILMKDFYTPLIGDLGNAKKDVQLYTGELKGTTAYLDPQLIALKYYTNPQSQQELNKIEAQIQVRYQMADEYALGATILKILMPFSNLDFDENTGYSNIMEIAESANSKEEKLIIKFLKFLMTNDLKKRIRIEQLEYYYIQFIIQIKKVLGNQIHFGLFLDQQFDFYISKKYDQNEPQLWEQYKRKINLYRSSFNKSNITDQDFNNFFNKFEKYLLKKQRDEMKVQNPQNQLKFDLLKKKPTSQLIVHQRPSALRQRLPLINFFKNIKMEKTKNVAKNKQEFQKNGLVHQFKIYGNKKQLVQPLRIKPQSQLKISPWKMIQLNNIIFIFNKLYQLYSKNHKSQNNIGSQFYNNQQLLYQVFQTIKFQQTLIKFYQKQHNKQIYTQLKFPIIKDKSQYKTLQNIKTFITCKLQHINIILY